MTTTCTRYFLSPAGALQPIEEPGRCIEYWRLWREWLLLESTLATLPETKFSRTKNAAAMKQKWLWKHMTDCPDCRAWLDRCEANAARVAERLTL